MKDFQFFAPITDFDVVKSGDDQTMRIGGFVSSEREDRQGEKVIQKGLDFAPFLEYGWFNDNHKKEMTKGGAIGYPAKENAVIWLKKGDPKPLNGISADRSGWYVHGELLDTEEGRDTYSFIKAVEKVPHRNVGFSLEGKVKSRQGNKLLKAAVHHIAITHVPVSHDTAVEALSKAMAEANEELSVVPEPTAETELEKGGVRLLEDGEGFLLQIPVTRAQAAEYLAKATMAGDSMDNDGSTGFAMRTESMDEYSRPAKDEDEEEEKEEKESSKKGSLPFERAMSLVKQRWPGLNDKQSGVVARRIERKLLSLRNAS